MGEPLNNYDAVRSAVSMMTDGGMFAMRRKAVTVSTVGVIPRIRQLVQDLPGMDKSYVRYVMMCCAVFWYHLVPSPPCSQG